MLDDKDREVAVQQLGLDQQYAVESYVRKTDEIQVGDTKYYAALYIGDEEILETQPPAEAIPMLFTQDQIDQAILNAKQAEAAGHLDDVAFLVIRNCSDEEPVSNEEEEEAVADLVLEHYSPWKLFKLFILSFTR